MKPIKITLTKTTSVLYDTNGKIISRVRVKEKTVEYVPYVPKTVEDPIKNMINQFLKDRANQ